MAEMFRLNNRECTEKQFVFALERLGISEINIELAEKAGSLKHYFSGKRGGIFLDDKAHN
jgi:hypothetical protein